jgi:SAM-dependent methyltransferase
MQARWRDCPTDFWSDQPFSRAAPEPDAAFYQTPRLVYHLDSTAIDQIEQLYARLLPAKARVLDLMASWKSHLPRSFDLADVAGLGMNSEELGANRQLGETLVHDLNLDANLPFADGSFDAVVCTVSVEYLLSPVEVFAEVQRILRPGGCFIVTFSNRWFPPKVVRIWQNSHEFERPGLVLEYFLQAGGYTALQTWSMRGLPRPADDKYADRLTVSDPVHAVWGIKT